MSVVRYTGNTQAVGTRSTPAPLAQCPPNSSDRQDKYVISPICLISSRTECSDVASNIMYIMYTQSQTDRSSVLWNDSPNRTECPMKFHKVSRTL